MTGSDNIARSIGLVAGIGLAVVLVASWRVFAPGGTPGAEVAFTTVPPGELTIAPAGALMRGRALRPGGPATSGRAQLRNIAGRRLALRVRLAPSNPDLDRLLRVELRVGGTRLAGGTLGDLRLWTRHAATLGTREPTALTAKAWLPRAAGRGAAGRLVDVAVEFRATPREGLGR